MIYEGFKVLNDNGSLIEEVPAILVGSGKRTVFKKNNEDGSETVYPVCVEIKAQVPQLTFEVSFINVISNEIIAIKTVENGTAVITLQFINKGILCIRVGEETQTKLNEAVIVVEESYRD